MFNRRFAKYGSSALLVSMFLSSTGRVSVMASNGSEVTEAEDAEAEDAEAEDAEEPTGGHVRMASNGSEVVIEAEDAEEPTGNYVFEDTENRIVDRSDQQQLLRMGTMARLWSIGQCYIESLNGQIADKIKGLFKLIEEIKKSNNNYGRDAVFAQALREVLVEYNGLIPEKAQQQLTRSVVNTMSYKDKESLIKLFDVFRAILTGEEYVPQGNVFRAILTGEEYVPQSDVANICHKLLKLKDHLFEGIEPIKGETEEQTAKRQRASLAIRAKIMKDYIKSDFNSVLGEKIFDGVDYIDEIGIENALEEKFVSEVKKAILQDNGAFARWGLIKTRLPLTKETPESVQNKQIAVPLVENIMKYYS